MGTASPGTWARSGAFSLPLGHGTGKSRQPADSKVCPTSSRGCRVPEIVHLFPLVATICHLVPQFSKKYFSRWQSSIGRGWVAEPKKYLNTSASTWIHVRKTFLINMKRMIEYGGEAKKRPCLALTGLLNKWALTQGDARGLACPGLRYSGLSDLSTEVVANLKKRGTGTSNTDKPALDRVCPCLFLGGYKNEMTNQFSNAQRPNKK